MGIVSETMVPGCGQVIFGIVQSQVALLRPYKKRREASGLPSCSLYADASYFLANVPLLLIHTWESNLSSLVISTSPSLSISCGLSQMIHFGGLSIR